MMTVAQLGEHAKNQNIVYFKMIKIVNLCEMNLISRKNKTILRPETTW